MPKLVNSLPKYRKHRSSGQAVVTLNGRDHYLGPHGTQTSRREYDRLIAEYLASGRSVAYGAPDRDLTVVELAADYVRHARQYYGTGPNSEIHRIIPLVRTLKHLYARLPASEFGILQFKTLRQGMVDRGASRSFVNASMRRLARLFKWAASEGRLLPSVPQALAIVPGLRKGKTTARETDAVHPVNAETVEATLPHLAPVVADMVRFQRLTGCRPAEVCALRPCDVDRSGDVWVYRPERHKTEHHGRSRTILIGPKAQAVFLRYLARDAEAHCFRPVDSEAKRRAAVHAERKTPLSCGNKPGSNRKRKPRKTAGDLYSPRAYHKAIGYACSKAFPHPTLAGIPVSKLTAEHVIELRKWQHDHRWAPNQLRHAAATEVRREFGLEAAQVILGHSQANVTQVYAERDLAKGVAVALAIG